MAEHEPSYPGDTKHPPVIDLSGNEMHPAGESIVAIASMLDMVWCWRDTMMSDPAGDENNWDKV